MAVTRALLSVSDKRGIVALGKALTELGIEILSTGGTASALAEAGVQVTKVSAHTGAREVFGGRVKTLHPRIHGGILFRRDEPGDVAEAATEGIPPIDLVVVNLYPFEATVARGASFEETIENIDIGGPAMVRAAAKNWKHVGIVVDPSDYPAVIEALRKDRALSDDSRRALMRKAFAHTAGYDTAIAGWLGRDTVFGDPLLKRADKAFETRYGENPHQKGAFYKDRVAPSEPAIAFAEVLGGKELSYNNMLDLDSALACVKEFDAPTCVVVKHNTPCGVGSGADVAEAFRAARETDPVSAFGGIVAVNRPVDGAAAKALAELFLEAIVAPEFTEEARAVFAPKKNLRLLALPMLGAPRASWKRGGVELRSVSGGLLAQERDVRELGGDETLKVVTKRAPTPEEWAAARFAWKVVKHVRSNAIVFARDGQTVGIGGGQTSRVDAVELAAKKAKLPLAGSAVASDAFFPFRDGIDAAAKAGATCIFQPGGSLRDAEAIAAADELGLAMVFTGVRHFRH